MGSEVLLYFLCPPSTWQTAGEDGSQCQIPGSADPAGREAEDLSHGLEVAPVMPSPRRGGREETQGSVLAVLNRNKKGGNRNKFLNRNKKETWRQIPLLLHFQLSVAHTYLPVNGMAGATDRSRHLLAALPPPPQLCFYFQASPDRTSPAAQERLKK